MISSTEPRIFPELSGARVRLRPYKIEDFPAFAEYYASDRSSFTGGPMSRDEAWNKFMATSGRWLIYGCGPWTIEIKETGEPAGKISLNPAGIVPERELGWALWDGYGGRGIATEAAALAKGHVFSDLGWETLVSYINPANTSSIELATRLGGELDPEAEVPASGGAFITYRYTAA